MRNNRDKCNESSRKYRINNRDKCKESDRKWRLKSGKTVVALVKGRWKAKNLSYHNNYQKLRRKSDPKFRLTCAIRDRLRKAVNKNWKGSSSIQLLGCSIPDFRIYLESKFRFGMSWENYGHERGQWCIDHIIPCAAFDLENCHHRQRCFHFSNLQPMWATENSRKQIKHDGQFRLI